jgi:hypothetical protein
MRKSLLLLVPIFLAMVMSVGFANSVIIFPSDNGYTNVSSPIVSGNSIYMGTSAYATYAKFNITPYIAMNITEAVYGMRMIQTPGGAIYSIYNITNKFDWIESTFSLGYIPSVAFQYNITNLNIQRIGLDVTSLVLNDTANGFNETTIVIGNNSYGSTFYGKAYSKRNVELLQPFLFLTFGSPSAPSIESLILPSYPNANTYLPCWINVSADSINVNANLSIQRQVSGIWIDVSTTTIVDGVLSGVPTGIVFNAINLSSGYALGGYNYRCVANVSDNNGVSPQAISNIVYMERKGIIDSVSVPASANNNNNLTVSVVAEAIRNSVYGYVECDIESQSGIHYYPNDTTNSCQLMTNTTNNVFYPSVIANEVGNWTTHTCALYISNYSDCRSSDLALHNLYYVEQNTTVMDIPITTSVYILPSNPKTTDSLKCYAKVIGSLATIPVDILWANANVSYKLTTGSVANNTNVLVDTFGSGLLDYGDTIYCSVRGKTGNVTGNYVASNPVTIGRNLVTSISTSPEPAIFGDRKNMSFTTDIATTSTKIFMTKPDGSNATTTFLYGGGTIFNFGSGIETEFDLAGTYNYTMKSCNCLYSQIDNPATCPDVQCAVPFDYPAKSKAMSFITPSNYYLYSSYAPSEYFGRTIDFSTSFSKPTNIYKLLVTYPDGYQKWFVKYLDNDTFGDILVGSGKGKDLNQTGNYSVNFYGGNGYITNTTDCLSYNECNYENSTLGVNFTIALPADYADNITIVKNPAYYGETLNLSFDMTNNTDATCVQVFFPSGNAKQKYTVNTTKDWFIQFTSGDGMFLDEQGDFNYSIISGKNNGSQLCVRSDCSVSGTGCSFYVRDDYNTFTILNTGILNLTYNNPILKNCEDLTVNFTANPGVKRVGVRFATTIYGNKEIIINASQPVDTYNWSVAVPYSEIEKVICSTNSTGATVCNYGTNGFWVNLYDNSGAVIAQSPFHYFSVDTTKICTNGINTNGQSGTGIGQMIGNGIGVSGFVGDMLFSLFVSVILTVAVAFYTRDIGQNPLVMALVFLTSISIFSVAGMMPIWIPIILIIYAVFMIVKSVGGAITGSGG